MNQIGLRIVRGIMFIQLIISLCGATAVKAGELITNSIPPNLFLTDNGFLFWFKSSGKRFVRVSDIQAAQKSPESLPAQQYPEGNWGLATNGFQLSLRFQKSTFTNGEPIIATMLMRNITNMPETYSRPTRVVVSKDGKILNRKDDNAIKGIKQISMFPEVTIFPQTQQMYHEDVNQGYDLNIGGLYVLQAVSTHPIVTSQPVTIWVTNSIH